MDIIAQAGIIVKVISGKPQGAEPIAAKKQ
jgi:hypothetical protein